MNTISNVISKRAVSRTFIGLSIGMWLALIGSAALGAEAPKAPKLKPVATCADGGTYSNVSGEHRGACSGHGGVIAWADGSPVKSHGTTSSYTAPKGKK